MNKFKKSQVLWFFVLLLLLAITPLLPSSLRPTYLYFISNLIIISLSAEAGLFSVSLHNPVIPSEASSQKREPSIPSEHVEKKLKFAVEKSEPPERVVSVINVQKGPSSRANLFYKGNGEADEEIMEEETEAEEEEIEIEGVNGQELFAKAEVFIGNFYKQLKMQREESWIY